MRATLMVGVDGVGRVKSLLPIETGPVDNDDVQESSK